MRRPYVPRTTSPQKTMHKHSPTTCWGSPSIARSSILWPKGSPDPSPSSTLVADRARSVATSPTGDFGWSVWIWLSRCSSWRGDVRRISASPAVTCARSPSTQERFQGSLRSIPCITSLGQLCASPWLRPRRILKPAGLLVVATHLGESEVYTSTFLGHEVATVGGTMYGADELVGVLESESFVLENIRRRDPLPHEHKSKRIYLTARLAEG